MGDIALSNRVVMAPLTRNRSPGAGRVPAALAIEYYRQRASAGLLITEATHISPAAQGYADTPGLYSDEQVAAWQRITQAVHAEGGRIVVQLWHVGRISHVSLLPPGQVPVSSTARSSGSRTQVAGPDGSIVLADCSTPRALHADEMPALVDSYRASARRAIDAGFDGVEVHAANGYLLEQFLRNSINDRHDGYGGSIEHRTRLLREVMHAVVAEIGAGRTGVRFSPASAGTASPADSDPQAVYTAAAAQLAPLKLAFMHVVEGLTGGTRDTAPFDYQAMRTAFGGAWMVNNGYTRSMALDAVASGRANLVAFGRPFISNPDLVRRLRDDLPLAESHRATYYGGGAEGYTDYPASTATTATGAAAASAAQPV